MEVEAGEEDAATTLANVRSLVRTRYSALSVHIRCRDDRACRLISIPSIYVQQQHLQNLKSARPDRIVFFFAFQTEVVTKYKASADIANRARDREPPMPHLGADEARRSLAGCPRAPTASRTCTDADSHTTGALQFILAELKAGVKVYDLCVKGDKFMEECAALTNRANDASHWAEPLPRVRAVGFPRNYSGRMLRQPRARAHR